MRSAVLVRQVRRILCIFPTYAPSFGTFSHAYPLMWRVKAFMPPQGLLLIASYLPGSWDIRFVDENIRKARAADFAWADVVMVSGMHVQARHIHDIAHRARAAGKATVLGGPSVSAAPEMYPEFDYLHIGELGDATDRLIAALDESVAPPAAQVRLTTAERLPMSQFPTPSYRLAPLGRYLMGTLQFSSGCPYRCEFCDIPALYGRQPRLKSAPQILAELDAIIEQPAHPSMVYFVDDNFIGNRKAAREMLPHLVRWQQQRGYPVQFACEATLNIAKQREILALMREAGFNTIFVGIESPEIGALQSMRKEHNASLPMLEAIETLNRYGLEVVAGIILGLDTDTAETQEHIIEFIERSQIAVLTMNLLQALPKTPLWTRLEGAGRIVEDASLESNVRFLRPYDEVVESWRRCIAYAYDPERLFARLRHQVTATYVHRLNRPASGQATAQNLLRGLVLAANLAVRVGLLADYASAFRRTVRHAMDHGQIQSAFSIGFVGRHLIEFTREALRGEQNASFYSATAKSESATPAPLTRTVRGTI
jgi:hopanoid C-2 methylase